MNNSVLMGKWATIEDSFGISLSKVNIREESPMYVYPFNRRRHLVNERDREDLDEVSNRRLTSMALDVARGLSYLAELKYVHRDVACR